MTKVIDDFFIGETPFEDHSQLETLKHKKYQKKKKHVKDNRKTNWDKRRHGDRYIENKLVKHLRAQKVYTAEERDQEYNDWCADYFNYHANFTTSGFDEHFNNWWEEDPWFYNEIGYGYLVNEEWEDYIDKETGRVLDEWELMARERELDEALEGWVEFCEQFIK